MYIVLFYVPSKEVKSVFFAVDETQAREVQ